MTLLASLSRLPARNVWCRRGRLLHGLPPPENEYTDTPVYPEIPQHRTEHEKMAARLADHVRGLRTVEERLWYLNKPKFFGWHSVVLKPESILYGSKEFLQCVTRTHVVDGLPERYHSESTCKTAIELAARLAPRVERLLLRDSRFEEEGRAVDNDKIRDHELDFEPLDESDYRARLDGARAAVRAVHAAVHNQLRADCKHLQDAQVDVESRTEAFWFKSGFTPPPVVIYKRERFRERVRNKRQFMARDKSEPTDEEIREKSDKSVQILATAQVKIRGHKMIRPFAGADDDVCRSGKDIPKPELTHRGQGFTAKHVHGVNNPGYWTSSTTGNHTSLQLVSGVNLHEKEVNEPMLRVEDYRPDMLVAKGLMHSFGVAMPEACYQGFGPFHDPFSPLAVQTVVVDGTKVKLFAFQLNKTALHLDLDDQQPNNVLWHSPELDLVAVDESSGEERINVEALAELIKFYIEEPSVEYQNEVMTWQEIASNYNREYFFHDFRMMQARQLRFPKPEILAWERLYRQQFPRIWFPYGVRDRPFYRMAQIDFKGREHWSPGYKHWDHHQTARIPQCERPDGKKGEPRKRKIVPPVPDEDQTNIYHKKPTHPWGPSDDGDWRNKFQ